MKSLILTLVIIFILSFIYIDRFTVDKGEDVTTAKTSVQSAIELLIATEILNEPYSRKELEEKLLKDYKLELVENAINNSNINFDLQADRVVEQLLLYNPEITQSEIEKELLESGFTHSEIQYAIN